MSRPKYWVMVSGASGKHGQFDGGFNTVGSVSRRKYAKAKELLRQLETLLIQPKKKNAQNRV